MNPFPKMFKIDSEMDIETDNQYAYVKLLTGQKIRLSREIVRKMYTEIVRRSGKVDEPVQNDLNEQKYYKELAPGYRPPIFVEVRVERDWPKGTTNAPIWTTSDGRNIPVVEMTDRHLNNAISYFAERMSELISWRVDNQHDPFYRERKKEIRDRLAMLRQEQRRRKVK